MTTRPNPVGSYWYSFHTRLITSVTWYCSVIGVAAAACQQYNVDISLFPPIQEHWRQLRLLICLANRGLPYKTSAQKGEVRVKKCTEFVDKQWRFCGRGQKSPRICGHHISKAPNAGFYSAAEESCQSRNSNMKVLADKNHKTEFNTLSPMSSSCEEKLGQQKRSLKSTKDDVQRCSVG